jgi:hypothetical protein
MSTALGCSILRYCAVLVQVELTLYYRLVIDNTELPLPTIYLHTLPAAAINNENLGTECDMKHGPDVSAENIQK